METLLEVRDITKTFSGVAALHKVCLKLKPGTVTAVIGENGAGKSTLLKIMSGIHTDYEGSIVFKDKPVRFERPRDAQDIGISIIHQELNLVPHLTVTQNIFLGRELVDPAGFLDYKRMNEKVKELLAGLKLTVAPDTKTDSLTVGQQQLVEIAKALLSDSQVLFMDEPTSAIGDAEAEELFKIIYHLKAQGKCIVYISHKLNEVFALAEAFVVLRDGRVVGEGAMNEISRDELVALMAGRKTETRKRDLKTRTMGEPILQVRGLNLVSPGNRHRQILHDINFDLRKGEVLGIYGLMGAGRTELCETLFGLHHKTSRGTITLDGKQERFDSPIEAISAGMALVTEDRKKDGIVPNMSVVRNMCLTVVEKVISFGLLNGKLESALFNRSVTSLKIKVHSKDQPVASLSGGNQQKVILAKWIERNPKVLMLDEPTRGIDVNAKSEIYDLIDNLVRSGISVIVVSSEIPEVQALSDRVLIMAEGRITAELSAEEATESSIMSACIYEKSRG